MLGLGCGRNKGGPNSLNKAENFVDLPQSVLQIVAKALQCDILIAAVLNNSTGLAETVTCVPKGQITVSVQLSKALIAAANSCEVINTEKVSLPSVLTAVVGKRPRRYLATSFISEGQTGLCYAVWVDPAKVSDVASVVMAEAGLSLPHLLANRVRALCCDQMGRKFDSILKRMPQAVVFVDDGRASCLVNSSAASLLGLPHAGEMDAIEVAGGMRRLADRNEIRADAYRCFGTLAGNPHQAYEWVWNLKDPRSVLRVRSYPISNNVATHGRVWLFDDVTKERDAKDAVEAADIAKTQFLAMMSHELRTPMTGVLGMLDLLRLTALTPEQAGLVRVMQGSAEGLMQVLNEILDFSKIQSGHLALDDVDFHVGELLEQVCALFQGRLAEKRLRLHVTKPSVDEMAVKGDSNRLRQVLTNLVSNAIKFTESGNISIKWQRTHKCNVLPAVVPENKNIGKVGRIHGHEVVTNRSRNGHTAGGDHLQLNRHNDEMNHSVERLSGVENVLRMVLAESPFRSMGNTEGENGGTGNLHGDISFEQADEGEASRFVVDNEEREQGKQMWFEVRVTDTGIGLTQEQQSRLFQSFSQADSSTTRKFGGTGLGLAISKGLVEVMGGRIWVESEIGVGSTFAFCVPLRCAVNMVNYLPTKPEPPCPPRPTPFKVVKDKSLQVLVAEDNKVTQLLISKMLKHYGHGVKLVANGQLAVEALQTGKHDMILMDLQMPVLDGLSATKAIRALGGRTADIPIYALTADVCSKGDLSLEAMGLDGYLTKPINWQRLSHVIEKVVKGNRRSR